MTKKENIVTINEMRVWGLSPRRSGSNATYQIFYNISLLSQLSKFVVILRKNNRIKSKDNF